MCGILGALGKFDRPLFETGLNSIAHRGPDGFGIDDQVDNLLLGHRRLAIVDLSDLGKQPMWDEHLAIIFNGEIYNYKEIKKVLEDLGHRFSSNSDTEVILKAYKQWGVQCLDHFNGMWAFAIWDQRNLKLFLSRDRFGVKPLFYSFTKKGFVFGSEMKALAPLLDDIALSQNFEWCLNNLYNYETSEHSLIQGIKRFPAGCYAYVSSDDNQLNATSYWNTLNHITLVNSSYDEQVEHFREIFFDACKIRMRSDVKIGTALSGGLDSSAVAAAMNACAPDQNGTDWQNAFVAKFTGTELDESQYAKEVITSLNLKGFYKEIDSAEGINQMHNHLWYFEELFLTSPIPMMKIYEEVKSRGVTVSLDGHGADELLSGYGTTLFNAVKDSPFNIANIKQLTSIYKNSKGIAKSDLHVLIDGFAGKKNMLMFYLSKLLGSFSQEDDMLVQRLGYFNAALYKDFHFTILPTLLRNYDRYSMASGVEVRMPFMDYRLVTYTFSLPWQSKLRGGYNKAILRDAIDQYLPLSIVRRKSKTGFSTPFTNWLLGPWKEYILDTINSQAFVNSAIIDKRRVARIVEDFYKIERHTLEDGVKVWEALMPYFWEQSFFVKLKNTSYA